MRRRAKYTFSTVILALAALIGSNAYAASSKEDYVREPVPPGVKVEVSELEGPVFANAQGRTLYIWPRQSLRNGSLGEDFNKPVCSDQVARETTGAQSPYPGGLLLPELDTRPSCTRVWPPLYADANAKPVGNWTIVDRPDGRKQWAYERRPVYMFVHDKRPGDVLGATALYNGGDSRAALRRPLQPDANVPGQFVVNTTMYGRLVTLRDGRSVYTYDGDGANKSNCTGACLNQWVPVAAPASATHAAGWTTFERAPGAMQWAFQGRPVYQRPSDTKLGSLEGSDTPGWRNVYTQRTSAPPKGFALKPTTVGDVLGDARGMTIYRYTCADDGYDQLLCDLPENPQVHRFAVCGGGDPGLCVQTFPYIIAPKGAKTGNQLWGTTYIDPKTGKRATASAPGALNVYTFRDRPVYTFAGSRGYGDRTPYDIWANNWGEGEGARNGYAAMVFRDADENRDGVLAIER